MMVQIFKEPGSGLLMQLGRWYIVSDSGSYHTERSFSDSDQAERWLLDNGYSKDEISIAGWDYSKKELFGMDNLACVVEADALLAFWQHDDPDFLEEVNK